VSWGNWGGGRTSVKIRVSPGCRHCAARVALSLLTRAHWREKFCHYASHPMSRTALLMLLVPCLRSLADAGSPDGRIAGDAEKRGVRAGVQSKLRLRGGGRRAVLTTRRTPDDSAFGTIRSSLAQAEDGGGYEPTTDRSLTE
jgi:hypothetical protein